MGCVLAMEDKTRLNSAHARLDLKGKKAVVFGVADDQSIAWHIAKLLNSHGCRIALAYQERVKDNITPLLKQLDDPIHAVCDVMDDELVDQFFQKVEKSFDTFDYLIHSIAFAKRQFLQGKFF